MTVPSVRRRLAMRGTVICAVAVAAAGCSTSGLLFRDDHILTIDSPTQRAELRGPVTLRWTLKAGHAYAAFAVFLDRSPVRPGKPLPNSDDRTGVTVTRQSTITLSGLTPKGYGKSDKDKHTHDVTIVLLDPRGVRTSEIAATVSFVDEQ